VVAVTLGILGGAYFVVAGVSARPAPSRIETLLARTVRNLAIGWHAGHPPNPVPNTEDNRRGESMRHAMLTMAALFVCAAAEAHVRITPAESKTGTTETYSARVPTEGKVTTTSVQLDVPDGVSIVSASGPSGTSYELKKEGDRTVAIVWTTAIKPGDSAILSFVARNPKAGDNIVWKVHQRYADGTSSEWTGPAGSRGPSPVTKLLP
jgi:uncharacterized protein YcnI